MQDGILSRSLQSRAEPRPMSAARSMAEKGSGSPILGDWTEASLCALHIVRRIRIRFGKNGDTPDKRSTFYVAYKP